MALDDLAYRYRPATAEPDGALVLLHGRGLDENDLFPLLDLLDPRQRLAAFTPRAPLQPPGHTGNHWYVVERVGYPDPSTFAQTCEALGSWLGDVADETGVPPERTILGGFSQGGVMSYAMGLGPGWPRPAAILALSCFIPTVEGWEADLTGREDLPVYHSHGAADPIIGVERGRAAAELLQGRVDLTYREHPGGHTIDPRAFAEIEGILSGSLGLSPSG
ncbi:MAG: alpha/beta hydrolase [Solirubrobacterales bacterium]